MTKKNGPARAFALLGLLLVSAGLALYAILTGAGPLIVRQILVFVLIGGLLIVATKGWIDHSRELAQ